MAKIAVEEYFCTNGYVRPYINENDKMPIWDGNLFVYRDKEKLVNDNFLYPVLRYYLDQATGDGAQNTALEGKKVCAVRNIRSQASGYCP